MADYRVNSYKVIRITEPNGVERVSLEVNLTNQSGNPKTATYWMVNDTRATNHGIENALNQGFSYAQHHSSKVSISEDTARNYLHFGLPSAQGKQRFQFTGAKI